jgi:hypothetical protein
VPRVDSLFPAKFARILDRALQSSCRTLGDSHDKEDPVPRTRKSLKGQQVREMSAAMSGFKTGSLSQLFLCWPPAQGETSDKGAHCPSKDGGAAGAGGKKPERASKGDGAAKGQPPAPPKAWRTRNPSPAVAWKTREGKTFNDFFDFRQEALMRNVENWPQVEARESRQSGRKLRLPQAPEPWPGAVGAHAKNCIWSPKKSPTKTER